MKTPPPPTKSTHLLKALQTTLKNYWAPLGAAWIGFGLLITLNYSSREGITFPVESFDSAFGVTIIVLVFGFVAAVLLACAYLMALPVLTGAIGLNKKFHRNKKFHGNERAVSPTMIFSKDRVNWGTLALSVLIWLMVIISAGAAWENGADFGTELRRIMGLLVIGVILIVAHGNLSSLPPAIITLPTLTLLIVSSAYIDDLIYPIQRITMTDIGIRTTDKDRISVDDRAITILTAHGARPDFDYTPLPAPNGKQTSQWLLPGAIAVWSGIGPQVSLRLPHLGDTAIIPLPVEDVVIVRYAKGSSFTPH